MMKVTSARPVLRYVAAIPVNLRRRLWELVLLHTVRAILPFLIAVVAQRLLDSIEIGSNTDWRFALRGRTGLFIFCEFILVVALESSRKLIRMLESELSRQIGLDDERRILQKLTSEHYHDVAEKSSYNKAMELRERSSLRSEAVVLSLAQFQLAITLGVFAVALLRFNVVLACATIALLLPVVFGIRKEGLRRYRARLALSQGKVNLISQKRILWSESYAEEMRLFPMFERFWKYYAQKTHEIELPFRRSERHRIIREVLFGTYSNAAYYGIFAALIWQYSIGQITVGYLLLGARSVNRIQNSLYDLARGGVELIQRTRHLQDFFEFVNGSSRVMAMGTIPVGLEQTGATRVIELEKVWFQYPRSKDWTLEGVDMDFTEGRQYALVGANGSGKSTILKLISNLHIPTRGSVEYCGESITHLDRANWIEKMDYLIQDFGKYPLSINDFLSLGQVHPTHDSESIAKALSLAAATKLCASFGDGLETLLACRDSDGRVLSEGEWQRLAIARMFLNAREIWLMDEPTAHLDRQAEAQLIDSLKSTRQGRIRIIATHSVDLMKASDIVWYMRRGATPVQGSFDELLTSTAEFGKFISTAHS